MRKVVVAGIGMTKFGRFSGIPVTDLGREAVRGALVDVGLKPDRIQIAYLGNVTESRESGYVSCVAQEILRGAGIKASATWPKRHGILQRFCPARACFGRLLTTRRPAQP